MYRILYKDYTCVEPEELETADTEKQAITLLKECQDEIGEGDYMLWIDCPGMKMTPQIY